jgi:hypothetical protein
VVLNEMCQLRSLFGGEFSKLQASLSGGHKTARGFIHDFIIGHGLEGYLVQMKIMVDHEHIWKTSSPHRIKKAAQ